MTFLKGYFRLNEGRYQDLFHPSSSLSVGPIALHFSSRFECRISYLVALSLIFSSGEDRCGGLSEDC